MQAVVGVFGLGKFNINEIHNKRDYWIPMFPTLFLSSIVVAVAVVEVVVVGQTMY